MPSFRLLSGREGRFLREGAQGDDAGSVLRSRATSRLVTRAAQEIGFKQGYFIKKIKSKRFGSSSGLPVEGNTSKGILGQGVTIGPAKKTSGLAYSGVEQKLLDLGHDLA